jgi:hypothetical protein
MKEPVVMELAWLSKHWIISMYSYICEINFTLAKVTRSGLMLYISDPNMVPNLPNAVMT